MINSNIFVCQLPEDVQASIRADIETSLYYTYRYDDETLRRYVDEHMCERLSNLQDTIDIWPYVHPDEWNPVPRWRFGIATNVQCIVYDADGEESYTEDMDALQASREIWEYVNDPDFEPILDDDGTVSGFIQKFDGCKFYYCDCDEETYYELH